MLLYLIGSPDGEQASVQADLSDPPHDAERVRNGSPSRPVRAAHVNANLRVPLR